MESRYYQIGELADLLNISRQMIRYYEECGVILPKRNELNNYRLYTAMDYFALGEAISLSRFDINIRDIKSVKMSDYEEQLKTRLRKFITDAGKQITYEQLMIRRAEQIIEKTDTAALNIGNVWVRKVPAHIMYPLMRSKDDVYGEVIIPKDILPYISNSANIVFGDAVVDFLGEEEFWSTSFDEEYFNALSVPATEESRFIPEEYCLCTVMDMGEIGMFKADRVRDFAASEACRRYALSDRLYAVLLARGVDNGTFHRYLEVRIPLKTL